MPRVAVALPVGAPPRVFAGPSPRGHRSAASPCAQQGSFPAVAIAPEATKTVPDLRRRWLPRSARWRCPLVAAIAVLSAVSAAATAVSPALLGSPLLLVALSPRLPFLVLAAAGTSPVVFVLVAATRLLVADPLYFALGRRHGVAALALLTGRLGRVTGLALRCAPLAVLLRPVGRHIALAGAGRSRLWLVAAADVIGTLAYVLAVEGAAHAVG
jgi:hypothetical protein